MFLSAYYSAKQKGNTSNIIETFVEHRKRKLSSFYEAEKIWHQNLDKDGMRKKICQSFLHSTIGITILIKKQQQQQQPPTSPIQTYANREIQPEQTGFISEI